MILSWMSCTRNVKASGIICPSKGASDSRSLFGQVNVVICVMKTREIVDNLSDENVEPCDNNKRDFLIM